MDPELAKALAEVLVQIATALAVAVGGWLASRLPGPLRQVMEANVHRQDVQRLVEAMQRRALAEVATHTTPPPTPEEIVAYVERVRGDLLRKMNVAPEALQTMATAAIATAEVAAKAPVVVAPVVADGGLAGGNLAVALHRSVPPEP
jgi:glucose-6-phosphate dehydrogenase assembly protein OpcA